MNKEKRKQLNKAIGLLNEAKDIVECVMDEEQYDYDNLTEGLKYTMRGQEMEEAVGNMESAMDSIDDAIDAIEDASL